MTASYENNKRWRKKHPRKWLEMKRRYYRQFQEGAYNKNQEWTIEDIDIILNKKITDRRISVLIGRSVGAIQAKRGRLKKEIEVFLKELGNAGIRGPMVGEKLRESIIKLKEEDDERREERIGREIKLFGSSNGNLRRSCKSI